MMLGFGRDGPPDSSVGSPSSVSRLTVDDSPDVCDFLRDDVVLAKNRISNDAVRCGCLGSLVEDDADDLGDSG